MILCDSFSFLCVYLLVVMPAENDDLWQTCRDQGEKMKLDKQAEVEEMRDRGRLQKRLSTYLLHNKLVLRADMIQ